MSEAQEAVAQENNVRFTLHAPDAESVYIAGTFNDWKPDDTPMGCDKNGTWHAHVQLEPGRYEYKFIVDGQWYCAPGCTDSAQRPHSAANAFGSMNWVLEVQAGEHRLVHA